jgi:Domain of unknown function (DUF222)/HNH endonuclease
MFAYPGLHLPRDRTEVAVQDDNDEALIRSIDAEHARIAAAQRRMLRLIAQADHRKSWVEVGARDTAHWLSMRYGISYWKAQRWIAASHALESLPSVAGALASGELHMDKAVELTRFATPETESRLLIWAGGVSCGAIRRKADVATRRTRDEVVDVERSRSLTWWTFDDGRRFGLQGELPSAHGAVVAKALDRLAKDLPVMPEEEGSAGTEARRADALVALCSSGSRPEDEPDRATVIVHARLDESSGEFGECEIEDGPAIDADSARRMACNARRQTVVEDDSGLPVRLGRVTREPPAWMVRHLKYRDGECRFPGCGSKRFTQAHHIVWWEQGGRTDLENLVLVCTFHHRLVHEYGWRVRREEDGAVTWFRREGRRYRPGPAPPEELIAS